MKKWLIPVVIFFGLVRCGSSGPDGDPGDVQNAAQAFKAQGTAIAATPEEIGKLPDLTEGITGLAGTITLRPSLLEGAEGSCPLTKGEALLIPYTVETRFEPAEAKARTLDRRLAISGKVIRKGDRCIPVADEVKDEGVDPGDVSNDREDKPSPQPRPTSAGPARSESSPESPSPERTDLPPLAPEVRSTFRPSLPDPPLFTR